MIPLCWALSSSWMACSENPVSRVWAAYEYVRLPTACPWTKTSVCSSKSCWRASLCTWYSASPHLTALLNPKMVIDERSLQTQDLQNVNQEQTNFPCGGNPECKLLTPLRMEITFECLARCSWRIIYRLFHAGQPLLRPLYSVVDPGRRRDRPGGRYGPALPPSGQTQMDPGQKFPL